jgi:hypothetical protein
VTSARFLVPLAAIVLAVFGTSRLMESIDSGPVGVTGGTGLSVGGGGDGSNGGGDGGDGEGGDRERGDGGSRERRSFFTPSGMRSLIDLLEDQGERVTLFRVQENAAQVQMARRGGGGAMVVVEPGPNVRFRAETPVAVPGGFEARDLDPRAPSRIRSAIRERSRSPIDYMVFLVNPVTGEGAWDAFLRNGDHTHFHADADGRNVTRP